MGGAKLGPVVVRSLYFQKAALASETLAANRIATTLSLLISFVLLVQKTSRNPPQRIYSPTPRLAVAILLTS